MTDIAMRDIAMRDIAMRDIAMRDIVMFFGPKIYNYVNIFVSVNMHLRNVLYQLITFYVND